jgi:hypothetical protein
MRFAVRFLRHRGRVLPWREVINRPPRVGDVRIEETRDEALRRYVRTAKLYPDDAPVVALKGLPELFDVRVVAMSQQAFTLSGIERRDGADYAQSWLVSLP